MNTTTMHIRINKELFDDFKKAVNQDRLMMSEVVRSMVLKFIREKRIDKSLTRLSN